MGVRNDMSKYIDCDMCGKHIVPQVTGESWFKLKKARIKIFSCEIMDYQGNEYCYDLCGDCTQKIRGMMSGGKKC